MADLTGAIEQGMVPFHDSVPEDEVLSTRTNAYVLPNGNLMVPLRAESADGVIGDGMIEVEIGSPPHAEWLPWALDTEEME